MAVTLQQIAERLDLSQSTISRILSNPETPLYTEATRARVLRMAREMGYVPNLAARSLRNAKTNMVGVFGSPHGLWAGIGPEIATGLSEVLHSERLDVFFAFSAREGEKMHALPAWRYDGAIVLQKPTTQTILLLHEQKSPFVAVNEQIAGAPAVLCAETEAMTAAMEYLWALGHRRIAYFDATTSHFQGHYSVRERREAYLGFMAQRGQPALIEPSPALRGGDWRAAVVSNIQKGGATAALAYDHTVAIGVLGAAQRLGLGIPGDFSLICVNDEYPVAEMVPSLTVIAPQGEEMGRVGARLLLQLIAAADAAVPAISRVQANLMIRESTAPPKTRKKNGKA